MFWPSLPQPLNPAALISFTQRFGCAGASWMNGLPGLAREVACALAALSSFVFSTSAWAPTLARSVLAYVTIWCTVAQPVATGTVVVVVGAGRVVVVVVAGRVVVVVVAGRVVVVVVGGTV